MGFGSIRSGMDGIGEAMLGRFALGKDCRRQYGGFALPTVLSGTGMVGPGRVERGVAWSATDGFGNARHGNNDSARKASAFPLGFKTYSNGYSTSPAAAKGA